MKEEIKYPCKGRWWPYVGYGLMLFIFYALFWAALKFGYSNIGTAYLVLLPFFLCAAMFRLYTTAPLMPPKFVVIATLKLFAASQVATVVIALGYFMPGMVLGHFATFFMVSRVYSQSREMH